MKALRQGSEEWLEARKALVTATDMPVLLGLSPYKCEADLADEKRGLTTTEQTVRMRIGTALEGLILGEYEAATGHKAQRIRTMWTHPRLTWAAASPDARVRGQRRLVELKWTTSRSRFNDGLPQDIEAQVAWQLGVTGYPAADVAVLTPDGLLPVWPVDYDPRLFDNLVAVAVDFRRRLADGGPFSMDKDRIRREYPRDDGTELVADAEITEAVQALLGIKTSMKRLEMDADKIETAIKGRMADHAYLTGPGYHVSWRQTKDIEKVDWANVASGLLASLPAGEREAVVSLNTTVTRRRPFILTVDKEIEE